MTKPFNPLELMARVKSQLRRYTQLGAVAEKRENIYQTGGLMIDDDRKEVSVDGEVVKLTPIEYRILLFLVRNQGEFFLSIRYMNVSGKRKQSRRIIP